VNHELARAIRPRRAGRPWGARDLCGPERPWRGPRRSPVPGLAV